MLFTAIMDWRMWVVITKLPFEEWFEVQPNYLQDEILAVLCVLWENGPLLGRPYVDTLSGSKFMNMKELRIQVKGQPIRICFAFDNSRQAIILCAGNKKGRNEKQFYNNLIKTADEQFRIHLSELEEWWQL